MSNLGFAWFSSKRCQISFILSFCVTAISKFKFVLSFLPSWLIPVSGAKGGWVMMAVRTLLRDLAEICLLKRQYYSITLLKSSACCCLWCIAFLMHVRQLLRKCFISEVARVFRWNGCACCSDSVQCEQGKNVFQHKQERQLSTLISCPKKCTVLITRHCLPCLNSDMLPNCLIEHSACLSIF